MALYWGRGRRRTPLVLSFLTGVIVTAALFWAYDNAHQQAAALTDDCGEPSIEARPARATLPWPPPVLEAVKPPPSAEPAPPPREPVSDLRSRRLTLPVKGVEASMLTSSFADTRGGGRRHEAMDILAPRNTPIVAVEDGTIARLFESKAGGLTVYQFDPTSAYAYYYAHLDHYAKGLTDGDKVRRGQVLGYVGTTGNAPPNTPHLHFAIFMLNDRKQWWQGTAIDPFLVLR